MTRYIEAFSWTGSIGKFLATAIPEAPLLNVCSGREPFGEVSCDRFEPADVRADWTMLPFADSSFAAVFADPPWDATYKKDSALFIREALRIAPVCYLMGPWVYGAQWAALDRIWVRQLPGINTPIVIGRYCRVGAIPPVGVRFAAPSRRAGRAAAR